jgi:hypothetical protein
MHRVVIGFVRAQKRQAAILSLLDLDQAEIVRK